MAYIRFLPSIEDQKNRTPQLLWVCAYGGTTILAGAVVWIVGHRGLFLFDQGGMFDGAWRLMQGQIIYRDFYTPFGPVAFLIQWLFFRISGVNFSSMVLSAAVLNSLAAVCVMRIIRRLLPDPSLRPAAIAGGVITGVWFQAPFGTLWFEQTSFFFSLLALVLVIETTPLNDRAAFCLRVAAGCSMGLAILSKQNAGVVFLPVPLGVVAILGLPKWRRMARALLEVSAGILIVVSVFAGWLIFFSSPIGFWRSVIVMSSDMMSSRLPEMIHTLGLDRFLQPEVPTTVLDTSFIHLSHLTSAWGYIRKAVAVIIVLALSRPFFGQRVATVNTLLICWIVLSCAFLQNIFVSLTINETQNCLGYLGLMNGLAFGLCFPALWQAKFGSHRAIVLLLPLPLLLIGTYYLVVTPTFDGWNSSSSRLVQQFDFTARFTERVNVPGASRVLWGDPTIVGSMKLTRKDFEDVNTWLAKANMNFFVFPDSTLLYGLHGMVSPQPWLYLIPELSFRWADVPDVDVTIVKSLQKNKVHLIVLEKSTFLGTHKLLEAMPQLQRWIHDHFQKAEEFGIYEIWTERPSHSSVP